MAAIPMTHKQRIEAALEMLRVESNALDERFLRSKGPDALEKLRLDHERFKRKMPLLEQLMKVDLEHYTLKMRETLDMLCLGSSVT